MQTEFIAWKLYRDDVWSLNNLLAATEQSPKENRITA